MIEFKRCRPEDVERLQVQAEQALDKHFVISSGAHALVAQDWTFSAFDGAQLVGVGGVARLWANHGQVWALLAPDIGRSMTQFVRFTKDLLATQQHHRLSAFVQCDFEPAHRLVQMLGFTCEAQRLRAYDPAGRDVALYGRVS